MTLKIYQLNSQKAVSETVDSESIVINLETGNYYSLNPTGSVLWNLAIEKQSLENIVAYCTTRYGLADNTSAKRIETFLESLVDEGLLLKSDQPTTEPMPIADSLAEEFTTPAFEKYEDMQEMLLADPIHDVDERGWPMLKKDPS